MSKSYVITNSHWGPGHVGNAAHWLYTVRYWSPPPEVPFKIFFNFWLQHAYVLFIVLLIICPVCPVYPAASYGAYPICKGCSVCSRDNGCVNCQPKLFLFLRRERMRQYGECLHDCPAGYYGMRSPELNMCSSKSWPHITLPPLHLSLSHCHGSHLHPHAFPNLSWFIDNYPEETHIPPKLSGSYVHTGGGK